MIRSPAVAARFIGTVSRSFALGFLFLVVASTVHAQVEAVDLTPVFLAGGIEIDGLMVYKISDIVLIRGRTSDVAAASEAGRFAATLGYIRVANLIEIVPGISDRGIERAAVRQLGMERDLDGCRFAVTSLKGVVQLSGSTQRDMQKDLAIGVLRKIDGVKAVSFVENTEIERPRQ